ncbi:hypothetical protein BVC80_1835g174 [Macleaya cordata]|uniref:DUF7722 domain-containing protein n=1 Tax=Macleaya cordata TaxID=56857 RepID=A0A200R4Z5_MACCD|nr:hypothetical protein BVC80_1835g174 [Macleaya cordata]
MENKKKNGVSSSYFQMPLHYPRYSRKDYEDMPEWKLDRLLMEYGLPAMGDLAYKREYAMGAFLWPDIVPPRFATSNNNKSPPPPLHEKSFVGGGGGGRPLNKKKV